MAYDWSKDEVQVIKAAWATDAGRLALHLIVERLCRLQQHIPASDALSMTHMIGRRSVGVDLADAINLPLDKIVRTPDEPRSYRPVTATQLAERHAAGD